MLIIAENFLTDHTLPLKPQAYNFQMCTESLINNKILSDLSLR